METGNEKVCRRCGTLNDERSLMCMRCGELLEITEEKKYEIFKGKMLSEKLFIFLFIILFAAYSFSMVFYAFPWIDSKLLLIGESYIFDSYNNVTATYIMIEVVYTICVFLINFAAVSLLIESILNAKLMKRVKINGVIIFTFIYMILSFILMTIYKYKLDYVIILEHLASIIVIFPYIRRKLFKRSI